MPKDARRKRIQEQQNAQKIRQGTKNIKPRVLKQAEKKGVFFVACG
jgi:hypothetical protein